MDAEIHRIWTKFEEMEARIVELESELEALRASGIAATVERLCSLVEGRNKSAPTKRNMTDADAEAVMTGPWKGLDHKEAAERIGLTYAQVYSCRLGFTFKHVHKKLRDQGLTVPWAK